MAMALWIGLRVPEWVQTGWVDHRSTARAALWMEGNLLLHILYYYYKILLQTCYSRNI